MSLASRRLTWQQPLQGKQYQRYVLSFKELLNAIDHVVSQNVSFRLTIEYPMEIVIADLFAFEDTVVLPVEAAGVVVSSIAKLPLRASKPLTSLFSMKGQQQYLRDLRSRVDADSTNTIDFLASVDIGVLNDGGIEGCVVENIGSGSTGLVTVPATRRLRGSSIVNNKCIGGSGLRVNAVGEFTNCTIAKNMMSGGSILVSDPASAGNAISANTMASGNIDTSLSLGLNTISANAVVGTLSPAGSDTVSGNS